MVTVNKKRSLPVETTHEGAPARRINHEQMLRRSVMACMLWENTFYESGVDITKRIQDLIPKCRPFVVADIAIEAREKMKLRHVPLFLARELARHSSGEGSVYPVSQLLERIIQRADELTEFLAIYWKEKRQPLSNQVKKGLAKAFCKFDAYQLAKYNRDSSAVKLRDVLFLTHPKPVDEKQEELFRMVAEDTLPIPDTWEVGISAIPKTDTKARKAEWTRLLSEKKLGALALLRNLRNMTADGVSETKLRSAIENMKVDRVLPFRFISAARAVPKLEDSLEQAMFKCLEMHEKLPGKTAIVVDNSVSMIGTKVSEKSDIDRSDAACALAVLLREICDSVVVVGFGSDASVIAPRRGFALVEAIKGGPGGGTDTDRAVKLAYKEGYDRIIVVTDEQTNSSVGNPGTGKHGYVVNVASYKNGIGYGAWNHIDGWSEHIIDYIREFEAWEKPDFKTQE